MSEAKAQSVPQGTAAPAPAFFAAALEGRLDTVGRMVEGGVDVNARDAEGHTALMLAAFNGHVDVLRYLLDAGAGVGLKDRVGRTALMYASTGSSLITVQELLKHGAPVNEVDAGEHWSALMYAAAEGQHDIVKALLAKGADPTLLDDDGDTAQSFALQRGHAAVANALSAASPGR